MTNLTKLFLCFSLLPLLFSCQSAHHVKPGEMGAMKIDELRFPLELSSGATFELEGIYRSHQGLVLVFWQSKCPCVKRYQTRVNNLYDRYSPKGLAFLHVSSNSNETFEAVKQEYQKRGIILPLARDEGGRLARALSIKGTPSAVLLDNNGEVKFMGWIDNERDEGESGREAYLEDAINEFLDGKPVLRSSSPMFGCAIR